MILFIYYRTRHSYIVVHTALLLPWICSKSSITPDIEGILPKGPYPPCLRMADRALLAGYPRYTHVSSGLPPWNCHMRSANKRRRYIVSSSLIGWAHIQSGVILPIGAKSWCEYGKNRDFSGSGFRRSEATLHCNVVFQWLRPYP